MTFFLFRALETLLPPSGVDSKRRALLLAGLAGVVHHHGLVLDGEGTSVNDVGVDAKTLVRN